MRALAARVGRMVDEHAEPSQRGRFFQMQSLSLLTGSRYRASDECVRLGELAVSESEGSANLSEACHVRFTLGLAHLWRGNFAAAIEHLKAALTLAERVGDLVLEARCLTYLAVAYRCSGSLPETVSYAQHTVDLAKKIEMPEYVAMAKANLAWARWQEGNSADAEGEARTALDLWHGMEDPYGFDWMALLPLVAIYLERGEFGAAIEQTRGMLVPEQHPLPDDLAESFHGAIHCWNSGDRDAAQQAMSRAMEIADANGRLAASTLRSLTAGEVISSSGLPSA